MCSNCHVVRARCRLKRRDAVLAACSVLGLNVVPGEQHNLYSGTYRGMGVQLPGWQYPLVVDLETRSFQYDTYEGRWGDRKELDRFIQRATAEENKLIGMEAGYNLLSEQVLDDGSIELVFDDHAEQYNQQFAGGT